MWAWWYWMFNKLCRMNGSEGRTDIFQCQFLIHASFVIWCQLAFQFLDLWAPEGMLSFVYLTIRKMLEYLPINFSWLLMRDIDIVATVSMLLQGRVFFENRFSPCFVLPLKWLPVRWALSSTFKMHRPTKIFEWLNGSRPWWMIFCRVFWIVYNNTTPVHQNNVST